MKVCYKDENINIEIGEIITNHSMCVGEALECLGIDMDVWADEQGFDSWDYDAIVMEY